MKTSFEQNTLKKSLLGGASIVAFTAIVGFTAPAIAADGDPATTEIDTTTITATTATGLLESNAAGDQATTIDPNGNITLGTANDQDAVTIADGNAGTTITLNVTSSDTATADTLTFAGNVAVDDSNTDVALVINATNSNLTFLGDITVQDANDTVTINAGSGSADPTITLTFDTDLAGDEDSAYAAAIKAVDAADTVNLVITNSGGNDGSTQTFSQAVGGTVAANAVDSISIGGDGKNLTAVTFSSTVNTGTFTVTADATNDKASSATVAGNFTASGAVSIVGANNGAASLELQGQTNSAASYSLDDDTGAATLTINTTNGAATFAGTVDGAASGEGKLIVKDDDADAAAQSVQFTGNIGATNKLSAIEIGSTTEAGSAQFDGSVAATTLTIAGGSHADEDGIADFNGDVTATITLDDNTGQATASFSGTANQTITGTINAQTAGEGTISVDNGVTDAAGKTVTFASAVGGTAKIGTIAVGATDNTTGANAVFSGAVSATNIAVYGGNHADEDSSASFAGNVTATTITLDDAGGGDATITFNGSSTQTVTGDITAGNASDGIIQANNDVTVAGRIGATAVKALNIATGKTFTLQTTNAANAIDTTTITGTGTFVYDTTNAGADSTLTGAVAAAADGAGTLKFTGAQSAIVTGAVGANGTDIGAITVAGLTNGKSVTLQGDVYANGVSIDATNATDENTITFGNGADTVAITGNITSAENDEHTLDFNASTAASVTGNIGASGTAFKQVTATESLTVTGDIYSTATTVDNGKTLTLNGANSTISGTVNGDGAGQGTVDVANTSGTVTFSGAIGGTNRLAEFEVSSGSSVILSSTLDATLLDLDGTIEVTNDGQGSANMTLNVADGAKITLGTGVVAGETVFTVADVVSAGTTTLALPSTFKTGTITLADSTADASGDVANFSVIDTALVDYTIAANGNDIQVTAAEKSVTTTAAELGVTSQAATALGNANTAIASGDSVALTALNTALTAGGTEATKAAKQVGVQADTLGASSRVAVGTGGQVFGVASSRLTAMRSGTQYASVAQTGFASGDGALAKAVWLKPFGSTMSQDASDGIDGYDADTFGFAGGVDAEVANGTRVGASVSYASTSVEGDGAGQSETDIDSYQVTIYGDYTTASYYVEGMVGYAMNKNDTSRKLTFGGLDRTAVADYDSNQYMVSVGGGMPINVGGSTFVTPTAGLSYTHVTSDSYTETGAGNLNMTVNPDDVDAIVGRIGARFHTLLEQGEGTLIPEARLGVSYDFAGDEAAATGTYTGGGAAFATEGAEVEQLGGNIGLGLTFDSGMWSVGANYDAEVKSGFVGHSASLEARFKF